MGDEDKRQAPNLMTKPKIPSAEKNYNPVVRLTRLEDEEKLAPTTAEFSEKIQEEESPIKIQYNCTICSNQFKYEEQAMNGLAEKDWKPLVFKTLCNHLNVPQIFDSLQDNLLGDSMRELRFCPECLLYSWNLLGMDQDLTKLLSEINVLTNSFRDIITASCNNGASSHATGGQENVDGQSVLHNFKTSVAAQGLIPFDSTGSVGVMPEVEVPVAVGNVTAAVAVELTDDNYSIHSSEWGLVVTMESLLDAGYLPEPGGVCNNETGSGSLSPSPPYSPLSVDLNCDQNIEDFNILDMELSEIPLAKEVVEISEVPITKTEAVRHHSLPTLLLRKKKDAQEVDSDDSNTSSLFMPVLPKKRKMKLDVKKATMNMSSNLKKTKVGKPKPKRKSKNVFPSKTKSKRKDPKLSKARGNSILKNSTSKVAKMYIGVRSVDLEGYKMMCKMKIPFQQVRVILNRMEVKNYSPPSSEQVSIRNDSSPESTENLTIRIPLSEVQLISPLSEAPLISPLSEVQLISPLANRDTPESILPQAEDKVQSSENCESTIDDCQFSITLALTSDQNQAPENSESNLIPPTDNQSLDIESTIDCPIENQPQALESAIASTDNQSLPEENLEPVILSKIDDQDSQESGQDQHPSLSPKAPDILPTENCTPIDQIHENVPEKVEPEAILRKRGFKPTKKFEEYTKNRKLSGTQIRKNGKKRKRPQNQEMIASPPLLYLEVSQSQLSVFKSNDNKEQGNVDSEPPLLYRMDSEEEEENRVINLIKEDENQNRPPPTLFPIGLVN